MPTRNASIGETPTDVLEIPASRVPVVAEFDIVVVGGGPGGFAAALKAARMGVRVALVEKYDMPGGVHTSGLQGAAGRGVGGIHTELMQRFDDAGYIYTATEKMLPDWAGNPLSHYERNHEPGAAFVRQSFNPDGAGSIMVAMLEQAGVEAFYGSSFVDAIVETATGNDIISAVVIENASGRQALRAKVFVDGTGTAELVARSGAPFIRGGGGQPSTAGWDSVPRPIPGGLLWIMSGIDFSRTAAHQRTAKDPVLTKLIAEATAAGDLPEGIYRPRMKGSNIYGNQYIGHPTLDMSPIDVNGTYVLWQNVPYEWALHMDDNATDESRAKRVMRQYIDAEARFLRKYVPGFEKAFITQVGRYVGIRDSRHTLGEYVFSFNDALEGRSFRDAVVGPITKQFHWGGMRKLTYEVPYRCFLPKGVANLLLTGASMSFEYETILMAMRNFPWCIQTGEIAGFAAARCIEKGIAPKELEWREPYF